MFIGIVHAQSLTLAWSTPTKGKPPVGYKVYYGTSSGNYSSSINAGKSMSATISNLTAGTTYYFALKSYDSLGNLSAYSHEVNATVSPAVVPTVTTPGSSGSSVAGSVTNPIGLVAAYAFDEISGTTVVDASGLGNTGTLSGATRTAGMSGYGGALLFDGVSNWVTVNDSPSLDLATGMTVEAWVYPIVATSNYATLVAKEGSGFVAYYLSASNLSDQPEGGFYTGQYKSNAGMTPLSTDKPVHLATTYDGQVERLYVNGEPVSETPQTGSILATAGALRIGGNSVGGQYFKGYLDDVRIYNVALTKAQIQKDMATPVNTSNPPQFVVGDRAVEPQVDYNLQGIAQAFQATPQKAGVVTAVQVYLDAGSTAKKVVAGIYQDNNNHPGALIAQGNLTTLKTGAWNSIPIPPAYVAIRAKYWIAILGATGQVQFRDKRGLGSGLVETSSSSALTSLPATWKTGSAYTTDGPMSAYGVGNGLTR